MMLRHRSEPLAAPLQVALLLSGGVDSSLALKLLQEAGHQVTAFYLQIWFQDDYRNFWSACPWEEDLAVCEAVRCSLQLPLRGLCSRPAVLCPITSACSLRLPAIHIHCDHLRCLGWPVSSLSPAHEFAMTNAACCTGV